MPINLLTDVRFLRMWPRDLFKQKVEQKAKGRLRIRAVKELEWPGVYVLYRGDELYYVGKAEKLFSRLHDHANKVTDEYYAHWDYFSAFALPSKNGNKKNKQNKQKMRELEAILIAAMPRATNRSKPRLKRVRIPRLLLTPEIPN
jgi:predicted GIY-YIG superfamily endonuclease